MYVSVQYLTSLGIQAFARHSAFCDVQPATSVVLSLFIYQLLCLLICAFGALMLLVGCPKEHPAYKKIE